MPRYQQKIITLSDGSRLYLPGSSLFTLAAIPADIDFYDVATTQQFPLGSRLELDDWKFRYIEFGGTTAAGNLVSAESPGTAHDDLDPTGTGTGAGIAVGSTIISIATSITLVVNEYEGGTLTIETDTGAGYSYIIESNEAVSGSTNANVVIKRGLAVAIDATSDVKLAKSRWKEVIITPAGVLTGAVAGVSVGVGANGSFGWLCSKGPWAVLTESSTDAPIIGGMVTHSDETAGAVEGYDEDDTANRTIVGHVVELAGDGEFSVVNLMLD